MSEYLDILGVPEQFSNAPGEIIPGKTVQPLANGAPAMQPSVGVSAQAAHEALLQLAQDDGWAALYDPGNSSSVTTDGGLVTQVRDSLGFLNPMRAITGYAAPAASSIGSVGALSNGSLFAQIDNGDTYFFLAPLIVAPGTTVAFPAGLDSGDMAALAFNINVNTTGKTSSATLLSSTGTLNWKNPIPAQSEPFVFGCNAISLDITVGNHRDQPDTESDPVLTTRPSRMGFLHQAGSTIIGPILVNRSTPDAGKLERAVNLLTRLTGAPATVAPGETTQLEGYATTDNDGNLTAAYRPDRPVGLASVTKLMTNFLARKAGIQNTDIHTVVPPYVPTDNRYPSVYEGDTIRADDAFIINFAVSHNRLSTVIANEAAKLLFPGSATPVKDFVDHMTATAHSWGWSEAVFTTPQGSRPSILTPRHVCELMRKIRLEDPELYEWSGIEKYHFTTLERHGVVDPGTTVTGDVNAIVLKKNSAANFPEKLGGKGGSWSNPNFRSLALWWHDPARAGVQQSFLATKDGNTGDRILHMRHLFDAQRYLHPAPASWSPAAQEVLQYGMEPDNETFVAVGANPNDPESLGALEMRPWNTGTDQRIIVQAGDTVTLSAYHRAPWTPQATEIGMRITGGHFTTGQGEQATRVNRPGTGGPSAWTQTTVTAEVQSSGVLEPYFQAISTTNDAAAVWVRDVVLTVTTPVKQTWIYRMEMVDYQVQTGVPSLDSTDTTGTTGTWSATVLRREQGSVIETYSHRWLSGKKSRLVTRHGELIGRIGDASLNDWHTLYLTGSSELGSLNAYQVQAPPFSGSLTALISTYLGLIGDSAPALTADPALDSVHVVVGAWEGELWLHLKMLCAAHRLQMAFNPAGGVHFAPIREQAGELPEITTVTDDSTNGSLAQSVEVIRYENRQITNELVYPPGGWQDGVEIITVGPGEYVEYTLDLGDTSITSFEEPKHITTVDRLMSGSSVFTIVNDQGLPVTKSQWEATGGRVMWRISDDHRAIIMGIKAPNRVLASDRGNLVKSYTFGSRWQDGAPQYSTIRILGSGVASRPQTVRFGTGVAKQDTGTVVGATVDNPFITSMAQASEAGSLAATSYGGPVPQVQFSTVDALGGQWGDASAGAMVHSGPMDYRAVAETYRPAGVDITAVYHLTHGTHQGQGEGLTYAQDATADAGLSYSDHQNRGMRNA